MTLVDADTGEVVHGELVPLPADPTDLDKLDDPGAVVVLSCERANAWLKNALEQGDLAGIVETKTLAETLRVYATQKQLGKDAELAAQEVVRRAERGLGLGIRKGQAGGTIRKPGDDTRTDLKDRVAADNLVKPREAAGVKHNSDVAALYALADGVTEEGFEEAIEQAKAEGDLTRANVTRKVQGDPLTKLQKAAEAEDGKLDRSAEARAARLERIKAMCAEGHNTQQISAEVGLGEETVRGMCRQLGIQTADMRLGNQRRIDPNGVLRKLCEQVEVDGVTRGLIAFPDLDAAVMDEAISSLSDSITTLTKIRNQLKKELNARD